jgi:hypothetical protein
MALFRISESVRRMETSDGAILLHVHRGELCSLNLVGAKILRLIERGFDEAAITEEICRDYDVDKSVVRSDVTEFIETLNRRSILLPSHIAHLRLKPS